MLTLEAAGTLAGNAQTATTVTVSVMGMELVGTTETYKVLYQGQLGAGVATIYTVPASTTAFVKSIHAVNTAGTTKTFALYANGTAAANRITPDVTLPANGWAVYSEDSWRIFDSTGAMAYSGGGGAAGTAISGLANSETTYSSGTVNLSVVGGAMTIRSTTGQAYQFSVSQSAQAAQTGISGISNSETTYTSGTVGLSVVGGPLTIRSTTGNAFQFSVQTQSVQAETQTFIAAIQNSETTYTSGSVKLSVVGGPMTIRSTTGQAFQFSADPTQTGISGISNSNTTYTSGTIGLSELGAITIRSTTGNQFQFSVNSQTVQTGGIYVTAQSTGQSSSSTYDLRTLSFQPDGIVSAGWSGGSFRVSGPAQTALTATSVSSVSSANAVGANNSRFAMEAHIHEGVRRIGISTQGNTAGSTGVMPGSNMVLVGGNQITLSGSTDASSNATISISGANAGAVNFSVGMSTGGNTVGTTHMTATQVVFAGGNNVTLSGSTAAAGGTITISAGGAPVTYPGFAPYDDFVQVVGQYANGSLVFDPQPLPNVAFDRIVQLLHNTNATNSSGSHTLNFWVGLYTRNASTLSQFYSMSGSTALTHSGTVGSYSWYSGQRVLPLTVAATTITENRYWIGYISSTSSAGAGGSYSHNLVSNINTAITGIFGTAANATAQPKLGQGVYSATTTAMPASVAFSEIQGTGSAFKRFPVIGFGSGTV